MKSKRILIFARLINLISLIAISYIVLFADIKTASILSLVTFLFCWISSGLNIKAIEYMKEQRNSEY